MCAVKLDHASSGLIKKMRYLAIHAISKDTPTYRVELLNCPVQTNSELKLIVSYFSAVADVQVLRL